MTTPLKKMHKKGCILGKQLMAEKDNCPSMFQLQWPDGKIVHVPTPWNSPEEKPAYIAAIRQLLDEYKVPAYTFVTEAWLATVNQRTQKDLMNVKPRDRSDREDILLVMTRHRDGEHYETKYRVDYDVDGESSLSLPEHMNGDFSSGLMGNLFEKH